MSLLNEATLNRPGAGRTAGIDARDWADFDPTGTNDNAAVLAAMHTQAVDGDTLLLPANSLIATSEAWAITKHVSIRGGGVNEVKGSLASGTGFDVPVTSPYMKGTVLMQTAAGQHGIALTGAAKVNHLSGFGIRFAPSIQFNGTGHGVYSQPPAHLGGSDHGLWGANWDGISVWGHDGDHYAFYMVNPLHCTFNHLRSYGGGGYYIGCDSFAGNYGNLVMTHPYSNLFDAGTANGFTLSARTNSGTNGILNFITIIRPQCNGGSQALVGANPATTSQYLFRNTTPQSARNITLINPDFESPSLLPLDFGNGYGLFVTPTGSFGDSALADTYRYFPVMSGRTSGNSRTLMSDMTFTGVHGPAPAVTALGTAAGTGGTGTVAAGSDDLAGTVSVTTGTAPTNGGDLFTLTLSRLTSYKAVFFTPASGSAGALATPLYYRGGTASGAAGTLTMRAGCATTLAASTFYQWHYQIVR